MTKIAKQSLSAAEIHDEIEWLISEHEAHMRLHRLKASAGLLEVAVTAAADVFENLAKFRLGALAKSAFAWRRHELALAEAERQAPGRELAYIIRARQAFG